MESEITAFVLLRPSSEITFSPLLLKYRANWIKAVQMCSKPREFALALAILECAVKPVVMLPIWRESLGHTR